MCFKSHPSCSVFTVLLWHEAVYLLLGFSLALFSIFLSRFFLTLAFGSLPVAICCVWTLRLKFSRALKRLILGKLSNFTCKFYECCSFFEVVLLTLFQKMQTSTKLLNDGDSLIFNRTGTLFSKQNVRTSSFSIKKDSQQCKVHETMVHGK